MFGKLVGMLAYHFRSGEKSLDLDLELLMYW